MFLLHITLKYISILFPIFILLIKMFGTQSIWFLFVCEQHLKQYNHIIINSVGTNHKRVMLKTQLILQLFTYKLTWHQCGNISYQQLKHQINQSALIFYKIIKKKINPIEPSAAPKTSDVHCRSGIHIFGTKTTF